ARHHALGHGVDDALLHRSAEVLRDGAAEDLVLPDEALAARRRLDLDDAYPVLAVPARLLDVPTLRARLTVHGLAIGDPRRRGGRVDSVLPLQLFQRNFEMDVAQPRDDELVRLLAALDVERGIFLAQPGKPA